tara:strand:- start:4148 stop:4387 length:240 start_codon:yes stop_codon:yes gene_type:complete
MKQPSKLIENRYYFRPYSELTFKALENVLAPKLLSPRSLIKVYIPSRGGEKVMSSIGSLFRNNNIFEISEDEYIMWNLK